LKIAKHYNGQKKNDNATNKFQQNTEQKLDRETRIPQKPVGELMCS